MRVQVGHKRREGASIELGKGWCSLGFSSFIGVL